MEQLPLNTRDELAPEKPVELPEGELEELIAALCARVLERPAVGRRQDFFDLGGDSLAAAEVAVGLEQALGVRIAMRDFARTSTVAGLASLVRQLQTMAAGEPELPLSRSASGEPMPASHAQERIWKLSQSPEGMAGYTIVASQRLLGPLDVEVLRRGFDHLFRRHEALRMTFRQEEGRLLQVVHPPAPVELPLLDLSAEPDPAERAARLLRELAAEPLDLERGPLLRLRLIRIGETEHSLQRVEHHINSDGASWLLFREELSIVYEALLRGEHPPLADELPVGYGDIAAWERKRIEPGSRRRGELLSRWGELAEHEATAPPLARPAPVEGLPASEGTVPWGLPLTVADGLEQLGRETGTTYYMNRFAIFAALLADASPERELVIGTYVTTRRRVESRGMLGCFTHLAPIRLSPPGDATVGEWLAGVRAAVLEANDLADLPYELVSEELARAGVALPGIRTLFAIRERQVPLRFAGLEMGTPERSIEHYMPSGFSFLVDRLDKVTGGRVEFDATIYDPALVRAFVERYQRLAGALAGEAGGDGGRPLRELVESAG